MFQKACYYNKPISKAYFHIQQLLLIPQLEGFIFIYCVCSRNCLSVHAEKMYHGNVMEGMCMCVFI